MFCRQNDGVWRRYFAALGENHKLIVFRLGIARARVTVHLNSIMLKLGARTHAHLVWKLTPMVEATPELRVPFEKARATNTEATEGAKFSESLGGPSRTRTWSQWIKNPSKASPSVRNREITGEAQCPIATDRTPDGFSKPLRAFSRSTLIASLYEHAVALAQAGDIEAARVAHDAAGRLLAAPRPANAVVDLNLRRKP